MNNSYLRETSPLDWLSEMLLSLILGDLDLSIFDVTDPVDEIVKGVI